MEEVPASQGILGVLKSTESSRERHFLGEGYRGTVVAGGLGRRIGHRVACRDRAAAELAERVGLHAEYSCVLEGSRRRHGGHDRRQVLVDLAVMLADGGEAIADIATLADQPVLHGPVASGATA